MRGREGEVEVEIEIEIEIEVEVEVEVERFGFYSNYQTYFCYYSLTFP